MSLRQNLSGQLQLGDFGEISYLELFFFLKICGHFLILFITPPPPQKKIADIFYEGPCSFILSDRNCSSWQTILCARRNSLYNHADGVLCDVGAEAIETIDRDQLIDCKRTLSIVSKSVAKIR